MKKDTNDMGARYPSRAFTSLAHVMDLEWMREAYRRTRKDAAVGVDGQTAEHCVLSASLHDLI